MPNDSDNLRLGISALDLTHYSYAENDELMTRGTDGKMFYKRPDGNIVAYDSTEYNKDEIVSAIKNATGVTIHGVIGNKFMQKYKYILDFDKMIAYSKK